MTHHIWQDSPGRVIRSSQRPLPDNTKHSQQTNIHYSGGIRNHNLSRRLAGNPDLRPRGRWKRLIKILAIRNVNIKRHNAVCPHIARTSLIRFQHESGMIFVNIINGLTLRLSCSFPVGQELIFVHVVKFQEFIYIYIYIYIYI